MGRRLKTIKSALHALFLTIIFLLGIIMTAAAEPEEKGIIGRVMIDGYPVIYKLVDEPPSDDARAKHPWLTVIAWQYDGSENNGMPDDALLEQMDLLERRLEKLIDDGQSVHAYSRTGKDLKELVYYIRDRDEFIGALNDALSDDPRYPINIDFYKDESWEDFERLRSSFHSAPKSD